MHSPFNSYAVVKFTNTYVPRKSTSDVDHGIFFRMTRNAQLNKNYSVVTTFLLSETIIVPFTGPLIISLKSGLESNSGPPHITIKLLPVVYITNTPLTLTNITRIGYIDQGTSLL